MSGIVVGGGEYSRAPSRSFRTPPCPRAAAPARSSAGVEETSAGTPTEGEPVTSIADPLLWGVTIAAVVVLVGADFLLTRRPHEVGTREAAGWSAFYVALPL